MPNLLDITLFSATTFGVMDPHARQFDVVICSATFIALPGQACRVADEQPPVRDSDLYFGEPGASSVRYEGEVAFDKPFADVLVVGDAVAPRGRKVESMNVSVSVGAWRKELRVFGDRHWRSGIAGRVASSPQAFERMPIVYDRAFGGTTVRGADMRNAAGVGFDGARSVDPLIDTDLPNIEYPSQAISSPGDIAEPAGFGVVARYSQPRAGFAGSFDDEWKAKHWPLLPKDFDTRHFQAAPLDQQLRTLKAGDAVTVTNMTEDSVWRFELPKLDLPLRTWPDEFGQTRLKVDTLLIEPSHHRFTLIARAKLPIQRHRAPLEELILGRVAPGWWHARLRGKQYVNWAALRGEHVRAGIAWPPP